MEVYDMSGWSISTLILVGMMLAVFLYGIYKLLRKNGLTLEVGGNWYGKLSFRQENDRSYISQASSSRSPQVEFGGLPDSKAEIEATTRSDKRNV
jgi:hypothetical protein